MAPAGSSGNKWNDAAIKDLTFAILMSNSGGNFNINANWDNVLATMQRWGYGFSKSAMSQQWTKRILKEFKERHAEEVKSTSGGNGNGTGSTTSTPRSKGGRVSATGTPNKTPGSEKGKKRAIDDGDDDDDNDIPPERTNSTVDPIARNKGSRASASKKIKYEEEAELDEDGEPVEEYNQGFYRGPVFYGSEDEAFEGV